MMTHVIKNVPLQKIAKVTADSVYQEPANTDVPAMISVASWSILITAHVDQLAHPQKIALEVVTADSASLVLVVRLANTDVPAMISNAYHIKLPNAELLAIALKIAKELKVAVNYASRMITVIRYANIDVPATISVVSWAKTNRMMPLNAEAAAPVLKTVKELMEVAFYAWKTIQATKYASTDALTTIHLNA